MAKYNGAEIIVEYLIKEKMPYVFGLCGHGDVGFLDVLYDRKDKIKMVATRHEQAAGHMADAYFRIAHKPVATITSCGPGSCNLPVAISSAMMDSSAFLAITGNVPTSQFNRCPFQETGRHYQSEFPNVLRPYVKRSYQPTRVDMIPLAIRQAFKTMLTGRPGPVNLDVPLNLFVEQADAEIPEPAQWRWGINSKAQGNLKSVVKAFNLLIEADKPLIIAGNGVILSEASNELKKLSKHLNTPVATTPNGAGSLDGREELSLGVIGRNGTYAANQAARNCDVLLALGVKFCDRFTGCWIPGFSFNIPPTKLIHVDIDPDELGRNYPPTVGILGDAKSVLKQLMDLIKNRGLSPRGKETKWLKQIKEWKTKWDQVNKLNRVSEAVPIRPERAIRDMRDVIPDDAIVLPDVGVHHNWLVQHWLAYEPQTIIQSWGFASMGFGVCGVLGAKLAAPERKCITVCGDAGFMMTPHILATAVEYGIPAVWVIWNNYGHCCIRDLQLGAFGKEYATSFTKKDTGELYNPDFVALAKSFGAEGIRVEKPADLKPALEHALKSEKPYVVDLVVDRNVKPIGTGGWQLPPLPPAGPSFT